MDYYEKNKWKFYLAFVVYSIIVIICWTMPSSRGWYDTMTGEEGLKNVISIVRISIITGCLMSLPLLFILFLASLAVFIEKKIVGILTFIAGTALLAAFAMSISSSICHFNVQCRLNGIDSSTQNFKLMKACIQDIKNDEYEEYLINNTDTDYDTDSRTFRGSTSRFYEYRANLMYGTEKVATLQTGKSEYKRFNEKPLSGFDAKITVYKNSGFLRSYEPTVEYTKEEAREHIFTLTVKDGKIYCQQNAEPRNPGGCYLWAGYRKGKITDYSKCILDADISDTEPYFNIDKAEVYTSDELNQICICFAMGRNSFERVSNIISLDDFEITG